MGVPPGDRPRSEARGGANPPGRAPETPRGVRREPGRREEVARRRRRAGPEGHEPGRARRLDERVPGGDEPARDDHATVTSPSPPTAVGGLSPAPQTIDLNHDHRPDPPAPAPHVP